ncbi:MAG: Fe-S oxidoreductase [Neptuniibacter caesariensis]|uniref:Fe-S oxidoreductase n=1 Tax=Neptuniibacter caesariensis TaxID=207954 RepID=A0A2G6JDZ1_NEPCE|nr:MAG: Fe-S oxidoreductase [Neptuniibacter caesariensis]
MDAKQSVSPVRSPCVGVCALDENDICIACHRTGIEIGEWGVYSNEEKAAIWKKIALREKGELKE